MNPIGPVQVEILGQNEIARLVREELDPGGGSDGRADVTFEIGGYQEADYERDSQPVSVKGSRAAFRFSATKYESALVLSLSRKGAKRPFYRVEIRGDLLGVTPLEVRIQTPTFRGWSALLNPFVKLIGRDRATVAEIVAKNIIYEILDPIIWMRLMTKGATFAHASAVAVDGKAVMFSGSGGVGKSTSLLSLMQSDRDVQYLGDDLVIVDQGGHVMRHPKRLQIYEYNLRGSERTREALFRRLGPREARVWRVRAAVLGPRRVRKRISAEELFGPERVAAEAELHSVAWVTPAQGNSGWKQFDKVSLVTHGTAAIVDEFWDFLRLVNLASELDSRAPSLMALSAKSTGLLTAGLRNAYCYQLDFPTRSGESFVASFIEEVRARRS